MNELADRARIHDVLVRYAEGLDRRDLDAVRSCFAPDVSAEGARPHVADGPPARRASSRGGVS